MVIIRKCTPIRGINQINRHINEKKTGGTIQDVHNKSVRNVWSFTPKESGKDF